ncbi:unnamed protein product [Dibothriocephalus latus]|uniref:Secreted protein n=1 Tax=Dibothriocephalus latus TaxID=60516 RepID=A0A3P7MTP2_DIBLA|nr:unnamed protein product [Dibothriocephalus latus]
MIKVLHCTAWWGIEIDLCFICRTLSFCFAQVGGSARNATTTFSIRNYRNQNQTVLSPAPTIDLLWLWEINWKNSYCASSYAPYTVRPH